MAIYDFVCRKCDHPFEVFLNSFVKEKQKNCPSCGSSDVRQTFRSFLRSGPAPSTGCAAPPSSGFG